MSDEYESVAELSVQPPTRATVNFFSTDPDRYVVSQLSVLGSEDLAHDVAARITEQSGEEITIAALRRLVAIEQVPESDIVTVTTTADDPQKAVAISQAYVELYIDGLATTDEDEVQKGELEQQIQALENELEAVNQRLVEAMRPYLPVGNDATPDPIPLPENVDPSGVSQRTLLEADLAQKKAALNDLDQQSRLRVNTEIISNASVPLEALPPGGNFLLAGGLAAGAIFGVVLAMMWARFSAKVLDELSAAEIIGAPVASELPHYRSLARNPLAAFQALPRSAVPTVDQLCVRAEALARIGEPLTVVVAGTMRSAGSTTLALAMAERFAAGGASVVVVDADVRDPRITALFNATADGGVPAVIANEGAFIDQRGRPAFTRTMDPAVSVLGLGPNRGSAALRRDTVPVVLEAARHKAEIVVVDGGPVLDLASTLQFAVLVDAVVLAVPLARQKADDLSNMARQLESVRAKLLPVLTSPSRRTAKGAVVGSDGAISVPGFGATAPAGMTSQPPAGAGAHQRVGGDPHGVPTYADYADAGMTQRQPAGAGPPHPPGGGQGGAHSAAGPLAPGAPPAQPPPGYDAQAGQPPPGYEAQVGQPPPGYEAQVGQPPPGYEAQVGQPPPGYDAQVGQPPPGYDAQVGQPPPGYSAQVGQPPPGYDAQAPPRHPGAHGAEPAVHVPNGGPGVLPPSAGALPPNGGPPG
jgi:Mrp family chromosome partitioning ATPase